MRSFVIPVNFTDSGKLMGAFHIRNVIEALVVTIPIVLVVMNLLPFRFTTNLMVTIVICVPISGFTLIGVNDDSLTQFLRVWLRFRKNKRTLTYKGIIYKRRNTFEYIKKLAARLTKNAAQFITAHRW